MPRTYRQEFEREVQASRLPGAARAILLGMAVWSDYTTGVIRPEHTRSLTGIVAATGYRRSTVARYLSQLEDAGWLVRHAPGLAESRRGKRTWYELTIGKPDLPDPEPP